MGIDAEMFVRVRGKDNWLTAEQVRRKAWELASTIDRESFCIAFPGDFGAGHHCLSIVEPYDGEWGERELVGKRVIFQDAPPIIAEDQEQFIRVHLMSRYYGPGYERGDWPTIRAVAEWCELNIPHGEVWYGGDSSGVEHQRFGVEERAAMNLHFLQNGHRPYHGYFGRGQTSPQCDFCDAPMFHFGGGGGLNVPGAYELFRCLGCGMQAVRDDKRTERYPPHESNAMGAFVASREHVSDNAIGDKGDT